MLVYCVFDAMNPETHLDHITGDSLRPECDLRKCIAYDAIEFRGTFGQLTRAWESQKPLPTILDVEVAPERAASDEEVVSDIGEGSGARGSASGRIMKRPARPDYLRPRNPDGDCHRHWLRRCLSQQTYRSISPGSVA